ncbi:hypothetical protein L596_024895 [Steinernema carpocapsae]|uniref:Uncharacterized protein n=1 Tax=Steinernema carpocapsae TaxID=34508 RepID=A0A4U5M651_STECR|nr:hypothetical protein L596_024895 [Steinernema carpocapsae]
MARINAEIGMSMSHLKSKASPRETDIYATLQRNIHQVPRSDSAKIWHKGNLMRAYHNPKRSPLNAKLMTPVLKSLL